MNGRGSMKPALYLFVVWVCIFSVSCPNPNMGVRFLCMKKEEQKEEG